MGVERNVKGGGGAEIGTVSYPRDDSNVLDSLNENLAFNLISVESNIFLNYSR